MFHQFQDIMHEYERYEPATLKNILADAYPTKIGIKDLPELKKFYWLFSDMFYEQLKKTRKHQLNYFQSMSEVDKMIMLASEESYLQQLLTLRSFSVFYACNHYLGTKGFESVSLD